MQSAKNDIINILKCINYPKKIARIYYKINSSTGGYIDKTYIFTSLNNVNDFIKYKDVYLNNFIKLEIITVESNLVEVYKIKTYHSLELEEIEGIKEWNYY